MLTRKDIKDKINRIIKPSAKEHVETIWPKNEDTDYIKPKSSGIFNKANFIRPILPLKKPRRKNTKNQLSPNHELHTYQQFHHKIKHHKLSSKHHHHKLNRHHNNPIMVPNTDNWWESHQVFNPGVVEIDGKIHMVYRSIGHDGESRLGYAYSLNGFDIELRISYPIYKHKMVSENRYYHNESGGSWGGCEDPRLVRIDQEDRIYMTYTAVDNGLRVGITSIDVDDFKNQRWRWARPRLISSPNAVNKNWVIFPEKINGKYAILHSISPKISIEYRDNLNFKRSEYIESYYKNDESRKEHWDSWVRGAGPPPLKTKHGWLIFYHAMDAKNPSQYLLGAMLTDLNDPTKIIHRSKYPILVPDEIYENQGFKSGVIYASGAIIKDGNIIVYYGGADSYVCAAYTNLYEFLNKLMQDEEIKLKNSLLPNINFSNLNINKITNNIKSKVATSFKRKVR